MDFNSNRVMLNDYWTYWRNASNNAYNVDPETGEVMPHCSEFLRNCLRDRLDFVDKVIEKLYPLSREDASEQEKDLLNKVLDIPGIMDELNYRLPSSDGVGIDMIQFEKLTRLNLSKESLLKLNVLLEG